MVHHCKLEEKMTYYLLQLTCHLHILFTNYFVNLCTKCFDCLIGLVVAKVGIGFFKTIELIS